MRFEVTPAQIISELFILTHYQRRKKPNRIWRLSAASFNLPCALSHTRKPSFKPCDKLVLRSHTHIWKLCSSAMAQPTARHEGDRGGEKGTAVSQTPLSGSSIRSASVHVCAQSPLVCRPPEDERLQGGKRFLMEREEFHCDLETQSVHEVMFGYPCLFLIFNHSPDCCSQAQFSARHSPHPKSLSTLTDLLSC